MAKKKSKKRRPQQRRPSGGRVDTEARRSEGEAEPTSKRQERKEEARRERERRIKQARRRQRNRRLARWGVAAAVVVGVGGFVTWQAMQGAAERREAEEAARAIGCVPIETKQDEVDAAAALDSQTLHSPPFDQGTNGVPITAGRHSSPIEGGVYSQPVDEANTIHNLEHGYVNVFYAAEGENALEPEYVEALETYVEGEEKILMAPYEGLANEVDFLAWGNIQTCDPSAEGDPDQLVTVLQGFVDQFRSGGLAPEPNGV